MNWMGNMFKRHFHFFLFCSVILVTILACGYQHVLIMGGYSMEPTFTDGQKLYTEAVDLSELKRGDIVYFTVSDDTGLIKRIIGLPGEKIEIKDGKLYINDNVLVEEYHATTPEYSREPITLKDNEYYVLGDNRNESKDSHNIGPITGDQIIGRVVQ